MVANKYETPKGSSPDNKITDKQAIESCINIDI